MAFKKSFAFQNHSQTWKYRISSARFLFFSVVVSLALVAIRSGNISGWKKQLVYENESDYEESWKLNAQENLHSRLPEEVIDVVVANTNGTGPLNLDDLGTGDLNPSWIRRSSSEIELRTEQHHPVVSDAKNHLSDSVAYISGLLTGPKQLQGASAESRQASDEINPAKMLRRQLRQQRKEKRVRELIEQNDSALPSIEDAVISKTEKSQTGIKSKYSIWRRDTQNMNSDSTIKLIKNQLIMAKVYGSIAKSAKKHDIYSEMMRHIKECQRILGEASLDSELPSPRSVPGKIKAMAAALAKAREELYDCGSISRKLRAMLYTSGEQVKSLKKQSTFLVQLAAKSLPKSLNCMSLQLTVDYYSLPPENREFPNRENLEDPTLYHYALFSDNVLAASVVVNSTVLNAKEPEKHVIHVVTDKLNYAAMRMWFLDNPPGKATINVENVDDFKWLNSSYSPVLRQMESAALKDYYFKSDRPTSLEAGESNLKYRNPKYLSMLNHLRFYLPQVYPNLDKVLFLDDDIVVQKDLTELWSIDLKGNVNGAVETCKESFHRFDTYLNFSNPHVARNFDPSACGWAFGMNIFDLKEWKRRDITGIYHKWQSLNEDRVLWKLGTLPPGLITFYNLTLPLNSTWHVLGLGYNPSVETSDIESAAVIHYNGNMKPWLELAIVPYRPYWTRYVKFDHPYIQQCNVS